MAFSRWQYWRRFYLPNTIYLLILLGVMGASYWYVRKDMANQPAAQAKQTDKIDGFAKEIELTQTNETGKLMYHATLQNIEHFGNDDINGQSIVLISNAKGQPKVVVKADQAQWHTQQQTVTLTGNIELLRESANPSESMGIKTQSMQVDMMHGMASSDDAFEMHQGNSTLTGKGFRYDYQLRDLTMGGADGGRIKATLVQKP